VPVAVRLSVGVAVCASLVAVAWTAGCLLAGPSARLGLGVRDGVLFSGEAVGLDACGFLLALARYGTACCRRGSGCGARRGLPSRALALGRSPGRRFAAWSPRSASRSAGGGCAARTGAGVVTAYFLPWTRCAATWPGGCCATPHWVWGSGTACCLPDDSAAAVALLSVRLARGLGLRSRSR